MTIYDYVREDAQDEDSVTVYVDLYDCVRSYDTGEELGVPTQELRDASAAEGETGAVSARIVGE